ncbi:DUF11 domain-containing protein, partial [bacterium]|nr:DUF11 domain-containing protein [bacterium]
GEIALNLFKNCGTSLQVKADGSYDTYCNDGEPDNFTDNIIALPEDLYTPGLRSPNLTITKTPDPFLVKNNQTITWTIQIDNNGSAPAVRTIVADTLPLYVNFFSASDTPIQEPAVGTTGMVEWVINDPIQPGGFKKLTLVGVVTCAPGDTLPGDNEVKLWTGCPDLQDTTALICVRQQASDTAGYLWHAGQSGGGGSHEISQQVPGVIKYCEQEKIIITLSNTGLIDITSPIHIYQDLDARLRYVSSTVTHSDSASFHSKVNRPDIVNLGPIATKTVERIIVTDTLPSYAYFAEANPMPDYPPSPGDTPGVTLIWVFDGSDASINVGGHTPISLKANIICPSDSTAFLDVNAATVQAGLGDNPDTIPAAGSTGLLEFGYTTTDLNPGETLTLYITVSSDCAFIGPDTNTVSISGATCWGERYILTNGEHEEGITGTTDRPLRIQAP